MKKSRILCMLLVLVMAVSLLTACSNDSGLKAPDAGNDTQTNNTDNNNSNDDKDTAATYKMNAIKNRL